MKRIGVVGIVLKGDRETVMEMQNVLSDFADIIVGRMGVPRKDRGQDGRAEEGSQRHRPHR